MLFPWSNEPLLEINPSHAAPQTKFGQTCHRFKHLGIPPQTPVDSYFSNTSALIKTTKQSSHMFETFLAKRFNILFHAQFMMSRLGIQCAELFCLSQAFHCELSFDDRKSKKYHCLLQRNDTMRVRIFPPEISKEHLHKFRWQRKRSAKMKTSHYS